MKSLKEISLPITEQEYRNDGCIHHSTLSSYEKGGFSSIPTLFDKKESTSLTFGSVVDCLITGSPDEFEQNYLVADLSTDGSDTLINVTKGLFGTYKDTYGNLDDIPEGALIAALDEVNYGKSWYAKTRIDKLKKAGTEYYRLMFLAKNKTIISSDMYNEALACVRALHESPATKFLFATDNPFEPDIERLYQLKFKGTFDGIDYSIMPDEVLVFHKTKKILPIDLKTSSYKEYEFYKAFIDWDYQCQARLYYPVLLQNIQKDDYFKDFEILNWHFVVVNKVNLVPLVWEYTDTKAEGTLYYGKNNQIECRHPFEIGKELSGYLKAMPSVPNGISISKPNDLKEFLNKL
jgi:hypothetical protein